MLQIVGIISNARQIEYWQDMSELNKPTTPEIYVPLWQHPEAVRELALLVRTAVDPGTVTEAVRREVLAIDSERPAYSIDTLEELADHAIGPTRVCLVILGTFAGVALLTACVGLYAVVSYSVEQRTAASGRPQRAGSVQGQVEDGERQTSERRRHCAAVGREVHAGHERGPGRRPAIPPSIASAVPVTDAARGLAR